MKRIVAFILCLTMVMSLTIGCGKKSKDIGEESNGMVGNIEQSDKSDQKEKEENSSIQIDTSKNIKVGILVSDATTAEALAFRSYYVEYIQKQYNVEFIYSNELKDAAEEKSAIDTFIMSNCKAVISFSSFDRPAQIEQCNNAKVYYAVATGTLTEEQYQQYKGYEYYVGAIGPSLEDEFHTGYDMAKNYIDQGTTSFAIFGGAVPYYTEMHIYRVAGMLTAMVEGGGDGANYLGATTKEDIIRQIYTDGEVKTGEIGVLRVIGYVGGYDMDDAWFAKCNQMAQQPELQVILAVGNGSDFFGTAIQGTDVKIASVDAYAGSYGEAMSTGMLDYLAGKFSASIGPIFLAVYSSVNGYPIRTEDGSALAISQGYWIAKDYNDFKKYYELDSSVQTPAYTKELLDTLIGVDYATFSNFVSIYSFNEIEQLSK